MNTPESPDSDLTEIYLKPLASDSGEFSSALEHYEREKDREKPRTFDALLRLRELIVSQFPIWSDALREYFANEDKAARLFDDADQQRRARPEYIHLIPFGHYDQVRPEPLGIGGIGSVHQVRDKLLGRHIAIKVPLVKHLGNSEIRARLKREARIGGKLEHPAIVPVHELGVYDEGRGIPFFTMKLIVGKELAILLNSRSSPDDDLPKFIQWFAQVCQAIAYAHQQGIVHRDIKPRNIMIGPFGEVQVTDWGLAKDLSESDENGDFSIFESEGGRAFGSPAYAAPEQLRDAASVGPQADVFGLGALLLEILTGKPPYSGGRAVDVAIRAEEMNSALNRLEVSSAPTFLKDLTRHCLCEDPRGRPPSGAVVAANVLSYLESLQTAQLQFEREKVKQAQALAESEANARRTAEQRAKFEGAAKQIVAALSVMLMLTMAIVGILFWQRFEFERQLHIAQAEQQSAEILANLADKTSMANFLSKQPQTRQDVTDALRAWNACLPAVQQAEAVYSATGEPNRNNPRKDQFENVRTQIEYWNRLHQLFENLLAAAILSGERQFEFRADFQRSSSAFAAAFVSFGVNISESPEKVGEILVARIPPGLQDDVAQFLDMWTLIGGETAEKAGMASQRLSATDHQFRQSLRTAVAKSDISGLRRLAALVQAEPSKPWRDLLTGVAIRETAIKRSDLDLIPVAIDILRRANLESPSDYFLNIELGNSYVKLPVPQYSVAAQYYRAALAAFPQGPTAYGNLGLVLMQLGKAADAEACFDKALQLQDDNLTALFGNALFQFVSKMNASEAQHTCERILRISPENANAMALRGLMALFQGNLTHSQHDIDSAFLTDRDSLLVIFSKAIMLVIQSNYDGAAALCNDFVHRHPTSEGAGMLSAASLMLIGSTQEAETACRQMLQRPFEGMLRDQFTFLLTYCLLAQSRFSEAEQLIAEVVRRQPENVPSKAILAICFLKQAKFSECKAIQQEIIALSPDGSLNKLVGHLYSFTLQAVQIIDFEGQIAKAAAGDPIAIDQSWTVAEVAYAKSRFRVSRILYERAIRQSPEKASDMTLLGNDVGINHRLIAAQAAVMDSFATEVNVPVLPSSERLQIRNWAADLLEKELVAADRLRQSNPSEQIKCRRLLNFIRSTPGLAKVRGNHLLNVDESEKSRWERLWNSCHRILESL